MQGDVATPGRFPCTGKDTVFDAIQFVGGFIPSADRHNIRLNRPARGEKPQRSYRIDLDAIEAADLYLMLLDIGSHRDLGHHVVERSPHRGDFSASVEPALAQDGVQLALLIFAHQCFSYRWASRRPVHRAAW